MTIVIASIAALAILLIAVGIAMSGGGRGNANDYLDLAAKLGARKTLTKPFPTQALLDAVNDVLRD